MPDKTNRKAPGWQALSSRPDRGQQTGKAGLVSALTRKKPKKNGGGTVCVNDIQRIDLYLLFRINQIPPHILTHSKTTILAYC